MDEIFRAQQVVGNKTITKTVEVDVDGTVICKLTEVRDMGGSSQQELSVVLDFTSAEWAAITDAPFTPAAARIISIDAFVERITVAEMAAFRGLMDTNATARAWWDKLMSRQRKGIDLDSQNVIDGFAFVKSVGIPSIWPDEATADARITELRA